MIFLCRVFASYMTAVPEETAFKAFSALSRCDPSLFLCYIHVMVNAENEVGGEDRTGCELKRRTPARVLVILLSP